MRSKFLAIGMCLLLVGLLVGFSGCPRVAQGPSISVEKLVSADGGVTWQDAVEQDVCQNVQFQITVTNDGTGPLTNIDITDTLPDCLEYVDGPAVELCKTQASEPLYYNLPGTHTPNWKCTEGLDPGQSAEVVFSAHVVCAENCCDTVSVEGEYDGQIVTDVDCAVVVGTCVEELILTVCNCDGSGGAPSPSLALLGWIDTNYASKSGHLVEEYRGSRDCDETGTDRFWAHTFIGLEPLCGCHIESAILEVTVHNGDSVQDNDTLAVGFIENDSDSWSFSVPLSPPITVGTTGIITLDLSDVDGNGLNLLTLMEAGFLDVIVEDDSSVDCANLIITYGP